MTDFNKLKIFLIDKLGSSVLSDVIDGDDITYTIYEYITIFCAFYISKISLVHTINDDAWNALLSDNPRQNISWHVCWELKSHNHMTLHDLYFMMCTLIGVDLPKYFPDTSANNILIIDLLCSKESFDILGFSFLAEYCVW